MQHFRRAPPVPAAEATIFTDDAIVIPPPGTSAVHAGYRSNHDMARGEARQGWGQPQQERVRSHSIMPGSGRSALGPARTSRDARDWWLLQTVLPSSGFQSVVKIPRRVSSRAGGGAHRTGDIDASIGADVGLPRHGDFYGLSAGSERIFRFGRSRRRSPGQELRASGRCSCGPWHQSSSGVDEGAEQGLCDA